MNRKDIPTETRQRVLDWLNKHGEASAKQLAAALGMNRSTLGNYLGAMRSDKELATREEGGRTCFVIFYSALVETTKQPRTAAELNDPLLGQFKILGRTTYYGTQREHPYPDQRGQGATRRVVGIQSSAEFI